MKFHRDIPSAMRLAIFISALAIGSFAASRKEQVLYSFQGGTDGLRPIGGVVFDQTGNLYGVTVNGGSNTCRGPFDCGTVYQLKPPVKQGDPWTEAVLYIFKGTDHNDGASPFGGLIFDAAGNLYGTTGYDGTGPCQLFGGQVGCGTVFKLSPPTAPGGSWTETVLYNFQGDKDGQFPYGDLVFDAQGKLYGATMYGGGFGSCNAPFFHHCGTIFELSPPKKKGGKWTEKVLYSFRNEKDGAYPNGALVINRKGTLYGTAFAGGDQDGPCHGGPVFNGCGTVFELKPPAKKSADWTFEVLHRFRVDDGAGPLAGVALDNVGNLFGTTQNAGPGHWGTVFELTKPKGLGKWIEKGLYSFTGASDGGASAAPPILDLQGNLFGTTASFGVGGGTVFGLKQINQNTPSFKLLYEFKGHPDGSYPTGKLVFHGANNIYGTTEQSGVTGGACGNYGCGTVFEASR